jgi:uncharacterized membrane protein
VTDSQVDTEQRRPVERLTIFSDAVVAIAITLLAIDLPVPAGNTVLQFWTSVKHNSGHYAAFFISFVAIAAQWSRHQDMFNYARKMGPRLRTLNFAWLFTIVLNPFATKLLTSRGHQTLDTHALRFGFYALVQALSSAALLAILHHMVTSAEAPGISSSVMDGATWQTVGMLAGFGLSIPLFFATTNGWIMWFVAPVVAGQVHRFWKRSLAKPPGT